MIIKFTRIDNMWRAYIDDMDHLGGMGNTPDEAIGQLVLREPHMFGITNYTWIYRPPNKDYPQGQQDYMNDT